MQTFLVVDTSSVDEVIAAAMWKMKLSSIERPPKVEVIQTLKQVLQKGTYLVVGDQPDLDELLPEGSEVGQIRAQLYLDEDLEFDTPGEYIPGPTIIGGVMKTMAYNWPFDAVKLSVLTAYMANGAKNIPLKDQAYLRWVYQACCEYLLYDTQIFDMQYADSDVSLYLEYLKRVKMRVARAIRVIPASDGGRLRQVAYINIGQEEAPWATKLAANVYDDVVTYSSRNDGKSLNVFSRSGRINEYRDQNGKPFNMMAHL